MLLNRPLRPRQRIRLGFRYGGDAGAALLLVDFACPFEVAVRARRISADDEEVAACTEILVTGAGWQQYGIAGFDVEDIAGLAAEAHLGVAASDAENLMGIG